jgi:phosphoribosylanthranilate isomerase
MTRVKICGISRFGDGLASLEAGADFLGFVFYPPSHRNVEPEVARDLIARLRCAVGREWQAVGVFVNLPLQRLNEIADTADLDCVQLCGEEDPLYCAATNRPVIKVLRTDARGAPLGSTDPADWHAERLLLDSTRPGFYGGTGDSYDWAGARRHAAKAILAGGLSPGNVREAIRLAQPWGVDVSSGVERDKRKDPVLIRRFLEEVKSYVGSH